MAKMALRFREFSDKEEKVMALNRDQLIELARANAKASLNPSVAYSFGGKRYAKTAEKILGSFVFIVLYALADRFRIRVSTHLQ